MKPFAFSIVPVDVPCVKTEYRCIQTAIPVPQSLPIIEKITRYESRSMHGQMPVVWGRAKDLQVFDHWGNIWIDFTSTIFVTNAGHANEKILNALRGVLDQELLHTYTYASKIRASFLEKLVNCAPASLGKAYLVSAGTEATEMVLKLIRLNAMKNKKRRPGIIAFDGSFHGRTMGAAQISGHDAQREWIGYDDPNIFRLQFPFGWDDKFNDLSVDGQVQFERDLEALRARGIDLENDVGGIVFESYIGWAAAFYPKEYVQAWAAFAKTNGILLAFDEIQAGFGRTGTMFAYEHYDVEADLISCGKGLSSSLPLAAVIGRAEIMDLPDEGSMSSTHSANPMSCAAGLANLEVFEEMNLVEESKRKGKILKDIVKRLQKKYSDRIAQAPTQGMVTAILLCDPVTREADGLSASLICEAALRKGLILVHTGRESIKIGPPLTIPDEALIEGMEVLEECMDEVFGSICEHSSH
ncbi:MAG: aminotransferase class III-fold pyridoxal phosphate-dependent enzyme [Magnetovibrio sp.]|nr:aminotransferase class III-fold pyridoxal phosphate-dependent enzyme [Magnetovibrio sp.]